MARESLKRDKQCLTSNPGIFRAGRETLGLFSLTLAFTYEAKGD